MSLPAAWISEKGIIYRYPTNKAGLRPLVFGDTEDARNAERYKAFRSDILTKHQPVMSKVASILCGSIEHTTPTMVDSAFDAAMSKGTR